MKPSRHQFHYFQLILLVTSILGSSCATTKFKVDKTSLSKHFETNPVFRESHSGLQVYDLHEKKVLFDYNGHKHFTPASNTKLLTYLASLKMMPDSVPAFEYCIVNDSLLFTGTGDPTLLYLSFDHEKMMDFLQSFNGQLVYVEKPIEDKRFGPGWAWDDYPYYYSVEKSSFPIYGNMTYFHKKYTDDHLTIIPSYFEDHLSIIQDNSIKTFSISREEQSNDFQLRFNKTPLEIDDEIPFIYSNELFVALLSDTLGKPITQKTLFPSCETKLYFSIPTDSIAKHILIESDNFLAEQMLLVISNQLSDTLSSEKVIKSMMNDHFSSLTEEINWVDGSGLSRYNQVTPHAMVEILKMIYKEVPKDKLYQMLPESSVSGTLKNSFTNLDGNIHAKTGSMSHVYNLSGYIETNSGKTLLFSFMNDNFNVSFSELKTEMERVLSVFIND